MSLGPIGTLPYLEGLTLVLQLRPIMFIAHDIGGIIVKDVGFEGLYVSKHGLIMLILSLGPYVCRPVPKPIREDLRLYSPSCKQTSWPLNGSDSEADALKVFYGCPHHAMDRLDMEDRLSRFLLSHFDRNAPRLQGTLAAAKGLTTAVLDINHLFIDSKHVYRSHVISVYNDDDNSQIDKVGQGDQAVCQE